MECLKIIKDSILLIVNIKIYNTNEKKYKWDYEKAMVPLICEAIINKLYNHMLIMGNSNMYTLLNKK